jgi:hypothetical protein
LTITFLFSRIALVIAGALKINEGFRIKLMEGAENPI